MGTDLRPPADMLLLQDELGGLSAYVKPAAWNYGLCFLSELGKGKGLYPSFYS